SRQRESGSETGAQAAQEPRKGNRGFEVALVWLWCGFGVALVWLWCGFEVPIGWLSVGFEVALGWLWTPEYMPSICLLYGFAVAFGGFAPPFEIGCWMFDVRCWMFRTGKPPR